jgi:heme/copper-type cytochrome/quinol oxidase subunit 4
MTGQWLNTLAERINSADLAIVSCIIGFIFFMKFNQREAKNKANLVIAVFMGLGFLGLVFYRIFGN